MLVLSADDQRRLLSMSEAMDAVAIALRDVSVGRACTPLRTVLPIDQVEGTALFMPALVESASALGIKFVSVFSRNKDLGKNTIHGVMMLANVQTGEPLALLEASYLTALRTGAATGLATKLFAREDSRVLAVIGTGVQARAAIQAVCAVRQIDEIRLFNRTIEKAERLAAELSGCVSVMVTTDPDSAVQGADIVVTATNSITPVFNAAAIGPGVHLNAIGSFRPDMQEIPSDIFSLKPKVVVESKDAALKETGDLILPIHQGKFHESLVYGELGEIVAGSKPGRVEWRDVTLFKSVGLAAMDVVVGKALYDRARESGIGQRVLL